MTDDVLGKRHKYLPSDKGNVSVRAKSLGFSSREIGELNRLYGLEGLDDVSEESLEKKLPFKSLT